MEIKLMDMEQIEARLSEIKVETAEADESRLAELTEEVTELENRKAEIKAEIETRKAEIAEVANGKGTIIENKIEEKKAVTNMEIRNTEAYINAFANYIKTGKDTEARALLTENVNGTIPVPEFVESIIAEAYRESKIMSRVRKMYAAGNVKVGFEITAPLAEVHTEGGEPITEEQLVLGIKALLPSTLKKWVSISDESLDSMAGESYLRYLYSEISRQIVKAEEKMVVDAILNAPQTATSSEPAVKKFVSTSPALSDFVNARALLTADASDLVIICTPAQYAAYKALAIANSYAFDPFEGIEVLFNDYATMPIIGDLKGIMANYPNGDAVQFKYDDHTLMTSDLVRVLGRKPVAIGVVGNNYFCKIGS